MKMELTDEKRKGYVVCALMILVSCLYLAYLGYSLYRCLLYTSDAADEGRGV